MTKLNCSHYASPFYIRRMNRFACTCNSSDRGVFSLFNSSINVHPKTQHPIPSDNIYATWRSTNAAICNWMEIAIEYPNGFFQSNGSLERFCGFFFHRVYHNSLILKSHHNGSDRSNASFSKSVVKYSKKLKRPFGNTKPTGDA